MGAKLAITGAGNKKAPVVNIDQPTGDAIDKAYDTLLKAGEGEIPSNEEMENISQLLEETLPEDAKLMRKAQQEEIPEDIIKNLKSAGDVTAEVAIDPVTGKATQIAEFDEDKYAGDLDDLFKPDLDGSEPVNYDKDAVKQVLNKNYSATMSEHDLNILMIAIQKQRDGEKVKFNDMPPIIQKEIMNTIIAEGNGKYLGNKEIKDQMVKMFLDGLMQDSLYQEIDNVFLDLDKTIKSITKKEAAAVYNNSFAEQRKILEEVLPKTAEKLKESEPDKADILMKVHEAYKQSYLLDTMLNTYLNTGKCKVKKYDIEKISRWYSDFNRKYENSKWIIRDINIIEPILRRRIDEEKYSIQDIRAFLLVFCKYTMNMKPANIDEHTFMYYFIMNIINLDVFDSNNKEDAKFYSDFVNRICNFIDQIKLRVK